MLTFQSSCFDYGNAETTNTDPSNGAMEAIYFGDRTVSGSGSGNGPWVMADLGKLSFHLYRSTAETKFRDYTNNIIENGLFSGENPANNAADPSISYRFVTAILKGKPNQWALRGGNAASGSLSTFYSGVRPNKTGYNPMVKQGAIVMGIGGDNSHSGQGTFYEGVMTTGYPSDATENLVQADIVAAGYAITSLVSGPALSVGSHISLRATTAPCCTTKYITHSGSAVSLQVVTSSSTTALQQQASFIVQTGLGNSGCFSFESVDTPGSYLRHSNSILLLNANDGSQLFSDDSTFCPQTGLNGQGNSNSIRSWSYPTRYFRHFNGDLYIAADGGPNTFDATASYNDDVSFVISAGFA